MSKNGVFITTDIESVIFKQIWNRRVKSYLTSITTEKLDFLRNNIEAGRIKSVTDKCFPLNQAADAHRYYEESHPQGKVVISVEHNEKA